jgi:hypothetical protein
MGEVIHVTRARVVKEPGRGMKTAYLDGFPDTPVPYGIHGGISTRPSPRSSGPRPWTIS